MSTLVINGAAFTQGKRTAERIASDQGMKVVTDKDLLAWAAEKHGWNLNDLERTVFGKGGFFNAFTHRRERAVACLRLSVAEQVEKGDGVFFGFAGLLVPSWLTHGTRILITGEKPFRIIQAVTFHNLKENEALEQINSADMNAALKAQGLFGKGPWDKSLYDLIIHADKLGENGPLDMIRQHMVKQRGISKDITSKERRDFRLAAEVELALVCAGGIDHVWAGEGRVVVSIKKGVMFQERLKGKIMGIASGVPGVIQVDVRSVEDKGSSGNAPDKPEKKSPVLLVDDEKRYVEALSERLKIRKVDTQVRYSGEDALSYLDRQAAEVMVLDLKMPGIDGFEVLRRIKATRPEVEVIILTGQGSEVDRKTCLDLGAFAFLERPVDIDVLTETMRKAHEKIRSRNISQNQEND